MRRKALLAVVLLLSLCTEANATPVLTLRTVSFDHFYDNLTKVESRFMAAVAIVVDLNDEFDETKPPQLTWDAGSHSKVLSYLPIHEIVHLGWKTFNAPLTGNMDSGAWNDWDNKAYSFSFYSGSGINPNPVSRWINEDTYRELALAITQYDPILNKLSWNEVPFADYYRIMVVERDRSHAVFDSLSLPASQRSYDFGAFDPTGHLIYMEAHDSGDSTPQFVNRSRYITEVPVPEPATLLLLGAGLAGLAGFRRRFTRR